MNNNPFMYFFAGVGFAIMVMIIVSGMKYSKYDLNHDGLVNLQDLSIEAYYVK